MTTHFPWMTGAQSSLAADVLLALQRGVLQRKRRPTKQPDPSTPPPSPHFITLCRFRCRHLSPACAFPPLPLANNPHPCPSARFQSAEIFGPQNERWLEAIAIEIAFSYRLASIPWMMYQAARVHRLLMTACWLHFSNPLAQALFFRTSELLGFQTKVFMKFQR